MNKAYRLLWNEQLNAWCVAPECASGRGKRTSRRIMAALGAALLAATAGPLTAADLAPGALPSGGTVAAGQAAIATSGTRMDITQSSQKAIINWQGFDIGSQAQVNFAQPNSSAVALNRVSGPNISRIEGQLSANGQVFLVNPNGMLFGRGARVNAGAFVASTLNIRDADFLNGNYSFSGSGGSIENQGAISAAPGGYLAFIAPKITNSGTINAPQGTVAMGAGERVRLNFAGDRLVGLDVSASAIDTLITNNQAIRAEGGAILLTAAGAEAVTRSVINNTGVLEASSLTQDGGRIVLTAGNDINLGAASTVAVDGKKGGEITVQAQSGTLLADGPLTARGTGEKGGTVKLLGHQVGLVNTAQVDASGTTGGGTVLVGGDYQGKNPEVQNALRTYVGTNATIKADASARGDGGKVVVWGDGDTRYYGTISARSGAQGGNGGFVEVSGKHDLDFHGKVDVAAPLGIGGNVLLDPQDIVLNNTVQAPPPNNAIGTPDVAFATPPAVGTYTIEVADVTGFNELFLQATRDITVSNALVMAASNTIRFEANNNINVNAAITTSGTPSSARPSIMLTADADNSGGGTMAVGAALAAQQGGITLSGASVTSTAAGTITATGGASANGGNVTITGTSAAGNINLMGAINSNAGAAGAGTPGRNAGNVTINGAGAVTTGAITANGSAGSGANQAGGNGGVISVTSSGTLVTGALAAGGGNGVATAAGGNSGSIAVTNNSTTAGTLTTGTLTARAGAAAGAIVSGAAGSVNVTNKAATLLQTGAIDTRGQLGGAGGNVALTSAGGVTVTSTIQTIGGALNATTAAAGRNAGNVTIKGVNRSIAGAITASGGAAIVAGQAGGAGGNVQITGADGTIATAGTLITTGITARNGNAVGTVASGTAGSITLEATQVTATGALTTTGGANGAGGNIALTSTGTLNINGAIATSGGTANASSAGRNAGNVTISGAGVTSIAAGTITASGSGATTAGSNQPGGAGGAIQVSSTNGITLGAAVAASGGAATTTNANGGNAGSITINNSGSGNISTTTLAASTGVATGTGAGGNAGFVSVTNTAASGSLTTTGITTTGGAKGNGGNVTLSALGTVSTTNSNITTSGGAGAGSAGSNAGSVTISGGGVNLGTGTVTANGGAGNGANQAGGNGATVQVTSTNGITANGAINATGGNGVAGIANGGNSGSINISNSTAGTIQTAALSARNGTAFTTGVGGSVGSIAVTNTAGNVTLGALTTSGQANGNGGNIGANATGLLTLNGAVASSGGANVAATTQAGKNAGTVTLSGNGGITTVAAATIAANGGAGLGANQAGGNAGAVSLTSSAGAISARAIASQTGAATGSGAGGAVGSITLNGTSVTTNTGALTTTGGANGNGGNITATATTGLLNVGAITTSGGAANANTAGRNAGAVTLTGDSVTTLGITANGTNGTTNGAGGNGGNVSVNGTANAVSVGAISTIGGNGVGGNSAGGNAGTISLDAGATTPTITLGGSLTATGGDRAGTGSAGSGGQIWLKDAVLLNAAAIAASAQGGSAGVGAGANVRFDGTINSTGGARALTVSTNAATIFGGAVGGTSALASLTTNAGGTTSIGGNVTTTGAQTYGDAVTLTGNAVLTGTTPSFASTVAGGGFDLTLNFSGTTTVNGANFTGIRNLATGNGGATQLTGAITTTGTQTYNDAVTLTGATTLASSGNGAIALNGTVDGAQTLAVNTTGATTFAGVVGGTTALTSLTTNAGGTTNVGGNVTTTGAQTYNDAVTLTGGGTRTFASTGNNVLAFNATVDGASALVANTTGTTSFAGAVGGATALTSLTTNAGGTTAINGGSVRTAGTQTYDDNVSLGASTTLSTTAIGNITVNGSVAANGRLLTLAAGLGNVVMQNAANDLATVSVTSATNVALRDTNAIDLGTSTIGANLTVTSGGAVTDSGVISVAGATTINAGASSDVTLDNPNDFAGNVAVQSGRNVRLNDINNLTLDVSTFGTLTATAPGTVTLAGQLNASGTGDVIVLSGGRFVNSAGASALSVPAGSRWLVWSSNPNPFGGATPDNRGGLAYDFKQYNATYGVTPVAQPTGNGFLYSLAPTITPGLTGTVNKVYDGNTTATLTAGNFVASGAVDSDTVALSAAGANYDNKNVGTAKTVTATGITASASNGLATVYGYTVSPTTASANIGEITPAPVTVTSIAAVNTTYGTPAATGAVSLNGVIGSDVVTSTASIVSPTYSTSSNLNAGSYAQNASSLGGADAGNYTLTGYTTPTNNYIVGQLALAGPAIASSNSTYGSPLNPGSVSFGNVLGTDVVTSTASVNTTTLSSSGNPIVGSYTQTAGALSGTDAGNYSLGGYTTPTANYTIGQAALTVTSIAAVNTTYGTPAPTGAVSLNGVIGSDVVTSTASIIGPIFSTSSNLNAGSYAQSASSLGGSDAGNYTLTAFTTPTNNYAVGQLALTGTAIAASSSNYGSPLNPGAVSFGNVVGADVVTGTVSVNTTTLSSSGNPVVGSYTQTASAIGGTDAGNYSFAGFTSASNYSITPLALTGTAIAPGSSVYAAALTPGAVSFGNVVGADVVTGTASVNTTTLSSSGNPIVGSYTQTAGALGGTDAGNYSFAGYTSASNYSITPLALSGTAIAGVGTTYGTPATMGAVSFGNVVAGDNVTSTASLVSPTYSGSGNLNVGSYAQSATTIGGTDAANYSFGGFTSASNNYTVGQLALTGAAIAAGTSAYAAALTPGAVSFGNVVAGDNVTSTASVNTSTLSSSGNPVAGSYTQTAGAIGGTDAGNYSFAGYTSASNYSITPLALGLNLLGQGSKVYDGTTTITLNGITPTLSGVISGDAVSPDFNSASGSFVDKNVGTNKPVNFTGITISGADAGNYSLTSGSAASTADITPAPLALQAASGTKVYDGTTVSSGVPGASGLVVGDTVSGLTQSYQSKNVLGTNGSTLLVNGGYTISDGNGGNNYTVTTNSAAGTITPAALSIAANDAQRAVDTPNPPFSATYAGFVGGETPAVLNGALQFSTPATIASPAGAYPITPYGQTSSNYRISYVDGVLDVIPGPVGPIIIPGLPYDPQAVAAEYSDQSGALGTVPAVLYVVDEDAPAEELPGSRVRVIAGGLKVSR